MPEPFKPIRPILAPAAGGEVFTLDIFLPTLASIGTGDIVGVLGPCGSGRTTALRLLEPSLPRHTVFIDDATHAAELRTAAKDAPVVYTAGTPLEVKHACLLSLRPWGRDQWIEYLLANRRESCSPVMARLMKSRSTTRLSGNAELWAMALDLMSLDPSIDEPVDAIRHVLRDATGEKPSPLERHPLCLGIRWAGEIVEQVCSGQHNALPLDASGELMVELVLAARNARFADRLEEILADPSNQPHTMPVTLLHLAGAPWRPPQHGVLDITKARLPNLNWHGVKLSQLTACWAHLRGACLANASIEIANLHGIDLLGADLRGAKLRSARIPCAMLEDADLSDADLAFADLITSRCARMDAEGANLSFIKADHADFTAVRFVRANLTAGKFLATTLADADFSAANLKNAIFENCDLRTALLHAACLERAQFIRCSLENVVAEALDLHGSVLTDCDLSNTMFRNAHLEDARFQSCGLADIDWESANLRNADFRGSTFHAGSSRSGLVSSPIACEGSKTGFYTDDFADRTHMAPEEIRKANLCRADLRRSRIDNVDFYLVDLRQAKYDPAQANWFKRCGAILFDKR